MIAAACGDDGGPAGDDDDDIDAASSIDADPNAPDADPNAPDADPNAPDADPNAPDADPSAPDADPGAPDGGGTDGVACGTMTCMGDQVCCITQGGPGGGSQMCTTEAECQGIPLSCDGPEDCGADEVCCGSGGGGGGSAECAAGDSCQFVICHTENDCPEMNQVCCDFGIGSSVCSEFCL